MKTLIIGIDGATFDIILPMIKAGQLPNIDKLVKNGVYGNLKSVFPPVTFPAWTSFKTGKNPAKHGVFDFVKGIPYTQEQVCDISLGDVREKSFWKILSDYGCKVGIINVPTTYPPEKVNGVFISGFGTPSLDNEFVYPPELKQILLNDLKYELDIIERRIDGKEDEFIKKLTNMTEKLTNTVSYLLKNYDFDFFMVNFMAADQTQHFFFGYRDPRHPLYKPDKARYGDAIEDIYTLIDKQIGTILSKITDDTNILLVSDHGFGPLLKIVYLNEWLKNEGYLKLKREGHLLPKIKNIPQKIAIKLSSKITSNLAKYLPKSMKEKANNYISWTKDIDWSETKAYSGGHPGKIFINLKGREKEGVVIPGEEYEAVINDLKKKLSEWKSPESGEKIVDRIYRKEEIYKGRYFDIAPDLMVIMRDMAYLNCTGFAKGKIFYPPSQGGDHRLSGIFVACGPDIKNNAEKIKNISICDVAPTILHMFNLPVFSDMDGRVLKEVFKENSRPHKKRIKYIEYESEKEMLREKISNLRIVGRI